MLYNLTVGVLVQPICMVIAVIKTYQKKMNVEATNLFSSLKFLSIECFDAYVLLSAQ